MPDRVLVVDHPVVQHRLAALRDASTPPFVFRQLLHDVSLAIAYEALRDLSTVEGRVRTPIAGGAACRKVTERVLLVPVLRAGLGMVPALQDVLPLTDVAHVGLRRDESTLRADVYLNLLPLDLSGRRVVVCDPMLATGGSLSSVCELVRERGATRVQALCVIASAPGLERFGLDHPEVPVACAAIDPTLDDRGFIVPGLGDAGDRLFGLAD